MKLSLHILLPVIVATALAGCTSPTHRYQTAYRYEPPTDPTGLACLEKCGQKIEACQQRCTDNSQSCLKRIEPQVDERYRDALRRYETELNRYRWELERYQLYLSMNWNYPPWYGHGNTYPWIAPPYYFPPMLPMTPSRDEEFNRLRQEQCQSDCGCQPIYDTCFLSCGGKQFSEVRCIANCPEGK